MTKPLILASASERRRSILTDLGVEFTIAVPEVEEIRHPQHARRTATENAMRKNLWCRRVHPGYWIISADTVIEFGDECIEKPESMEQARTFLKRFSGNSHVVITAVSFSSPESGPEVRMAESIVIFRHLTDTDIDNYFSKVNPLDKAGAYDIAEFGNEIIESWKGSWTNIMGLPDELIRPWLQDQGLLPPHT